MSPRTNDTGTGKRHPEGDTGERGGGHMEMEADTGVMQTQPRNAWGLQKLGRLRKDPSLAPLEQGVSVTP